MSPRFEELDIRGAYLVHGDGQSDDRGSFERLYDYVSIQSVISGLTIAQINRTETRLAGTVRGMHLQLPPKTETKIVRCLRGEVFDVIVDLRSTSPTFGQWKSYCLDGQHNTSVIVPAGCAHGLQTVTGDVEMLYLHTAPYSQGHEAGVSPRDSGLSIRWPLPITRLSPRDATERRGVEWFRRVQW